MKRETHVVHDGAGKRRLSYLRAGHETNENVVLCVHGLTRQGRDFTYLAEALAPSYRIICPDIAGRGESDRLADPSKYQHPTYIDDLVSLLDTLEIPKVDWIGTSMGGLIGMTMASAAATRDRVRRIVINDIGPHLPREAIGRIGDYVKSTNRFATIDEAERHIREVYAPYGALTDAQWRFVTECSVRQTEEGDYARGFDPALAGSFGKPLEADIEMWPMWAAIECPVLVLRGAVSDLLTPETAQRMATTGPCAEIVEIAGCGHAPPLLSPDQINIVVNWLSGPIA